VAYLTSRRSRIGESGRQLGVAQPDHLSSGKLASRAHPRPNDWAGDPNTMTRITEEGMKPTALGALHRARHAGELTAVRVQRKKRASSRPATRCSHTKHLAGVAIGWDPRQSTPTAS